MKKLLFLFTILISIFSFSNNVLSYSTNCVYSESDSISGFLDKCKPDSLVWDTTTWYWVESWLKKIVTDKISDISVILWLLAVAMIVYAGMLMQFSAWDDSKVKKAKDLIKWTLIWVIFLISAWWIVYIVINLMYSLWELWK